MCIARIGLNSIPGTPVHRERPRKSVTSYREHWVYVRGEKEFLSLDSRNKKILGISSDLGSPNLPSELGRERPLSAGGSSPSRHGEPSYSASKGWKTKGLLSAPWPRLRRLLPGGGDHCNEDRRRIGRG